MITITEMAMAITNISVFEEIPFSFLLINLKFTVIYNRTYHTHEIHI